MTLQSEPPNSPRMPGQQADVAVGSPLAVVAVFTEVMRERFKPEAGLAWAWYDNPTPREDEANDPDAPRKILIEPAFNVNTEVRNFRPAIYVDKGETVIPKDVLNHFVGQQLKSGFKAFWGLARVPMEVEVVAASKGESATLADIVWFSLLSGRGLIQSTFGLHELTSPVLGRTMPVEGDATHWSTRVSFQTEINFRWSTQPIAPLLQEIVLRFRQSGETNPDAFLLSRYLR